MLGMSQSLPLMKLFSDIHYCSIFVVSKSGSDILEPRVAENFKKYFTSQCGFWREEYRRKICENN